MFRFVVFEDERGRLAGFEASGHAGLDGKGSNLVCAAVSALVQTLVTGLKDEIGISLLLEQGSDGFLGCRFDGMPDAEQRKSAEMLMRVFERGFASLVQQNTEGSVIGIERRRMTARS